MKNRGEFFVPLGPFQQQRSGAEVQGALASCWLVAETGIEELAGEKPALPGRIRAIKDDVHPSADSKIYATFNPFSTASHGLRYGRTNMLAASASPMICSFSASQRILRPVRNEMFAR